MTNWFERAQRKMLKTLDRTTANTDERNVTAVLAVPDPQRVADWNASIVSNGSGQTADSRKSTTTNEVTIPMTLDENAAICAWLAHIDETDPAIIVEVLDTCRADVTERSALLRWIGEVKRPVVVDDDRRRCIQCANLTKRGLCLAARRGEIDAGHIYEPVQDLLQRCVGYLPKATESDQRPGRERWPGLIIKKDTTPLADSEFDTMSFLTDEPSPLLADASEPINQFREDEWPNLPDDFGKIRE